MRAIAMVVVVAGAIAAQESEPKDVRPPATRPTLRLVRHWPLEEDSGRPRSMVLLDDAVVLADGQDLLRLEPDTGAIRRREQLYVRKLARWGDRELLACNSARVRVLDPATLEPFRVLEIGEHLSNVWPAPDRRALVRLRGLFGSRLDLMTLPRTRTATLETGCGVYDVTWSADGQRLATVTTTDSGCLVPYRSLLTLRSADGKALAHWRGFAMEESFVRFAPDGKSLVWGEDPVRRIDLVDRAITRSSVPALWWGYLDNRTAISHDGQRVAFWDAEKMVVTTRSDPVSSLRLRSMSDGVYGFPLAEPERRIFGTAFSADRRRLALLGARDLAVFEIER